MFSDEERQDWEIFHPRQWAGAMAQQAYDEGKKFLTKPTETNTMRVASNVKFLRRCGMRSPLGEARGTAVASQRTSHVPRGTCRLARSEKDIVHQIVRVTSGEHGDVFMSPCSGRCSSAILQTGATHSVIKGDRTGPQNSPQQRLITQDR